MRGLKVLLASSVATLVFVAAGCGGGGDESTLVYGAPADPTALDGALISDGESIRPEDLPRSVSKRPAEGDRPFHVANFPRPLTLREIEMEAIHQTLEKYAGDKPQTADELGIALKTLYNKLNQYQAQDQAEAG